MSYQDSRRLALAGRSMTPLPRAALLFNSYTDQMSQRTSAMRDNTRKGGLLESELPGASEAEYQ